MTFMEAFNQYHLDTYSNVGDDATTRVWWLDPKGFTRERFFFSRFSAEKWIEEMAALETKE